jgi:hypothetical protein
MSDLNKSKGDVASLAKYKTQFYASKQHESLMAENNLKRKHHFNYTT